MNVAHPTHAAEQSLDAIGQRIARVVEVLMIESLGPELHRKLMRRLREG